MSTTDKLKGAIAPAAKAAEPANKLTVAAVNLRQAIMKPETIKSFAMALPKGANPERFARIIWTECRKNPELIKATPESIISACMTAAQLNLEIGGHLGQAYLVPFEENKKTGPKEWTKVKSAQLIIGYRGLITLARKSGDMVSLNAYAVYSEDEFSYQLGLHPDIHHVPSAKADRGNLIYVYAVANFVGGGVQFEVMSRAEIEQIRNASKGWVAAKKSADKYNKQIKSPWATNFDEMAKKTVIRRLAKYLPLSVEAARAIAVDEAADRGETYDVIDSEYIEKGGEAPDINPIEEAPAPESAPKDESEAEAAPAEKIAPEDQPDAGAPAPSDPWLNDFDNAQQ